MDSESNISWEDFTKVNMRVGTVLSAQLLAKAKKPAYVMSVDFGDLGILKTSAQLTAVYDAEDLVGRQVVGVVNFPKKQVANIMSEFLVLGAVHEDEVVILSPERKVPNGTKIA